MSDFGTPPPPPASPPFFAEPPRRRSSNGIVIALIIVAAVVITGVAGGLGLYVNHLRGPSVANHSPQPSTSPQPAELTAGSGTVVYSDDFTDPSSGWNTTPFASGTVGTYTGGQFVIVAKGTFNHFFQSPYPTAQTQLSMSVTATQSVDAPSGAGFGVSCDAGRGDQHIRYQFLVEVGSFYEILKKIGPDGGTIVPTTLKRGRPSVEPGTSPMTVTGACISEPDGLTTRLVLFVNGSRIDDITDIAGVPTDGWFSALEVASNATRPSTVTVSHFEERKLSS